MSRLLFVLLLLPMVGNAANLEKLKTKLQKSLPTKIAQVKKTPVAGVIEVAFEDGDSVYMSEDGNYILKGDIIDRRTSTNITKMSILGAISDKDTIVFSKKNPEHTLTIFTDVDCGYCRKLHTEVPELMDSGVKVRYMLFPRAGPGSVTAKTMESVWCATDQQQAMTDAKTGKDVPSKACKNPIESHMNVAIKLGLEGTPFIVTGTGAVIPGYRPAKDLVSMLEADPSKAMLGR